ncbi:hypothetical protein ACFQ1S_03535 [Kibdelosporangium lantanae]|uniref:Guanylate cyclase domain-containing protein n=1 Tax=Kibdelosporangium lantanae TaxID=1497396 RepID=A0ABW3M549_9PSEU
MAREWGKPSYRACAFLDVEGSSSRSDLAQEHVARHKYEVVQEALDAAGLSAGDTKYDRGDGILLVFEPTVSKVDVTEALTVRLGSELRRFAALHSAEGAMRMRIALHAGDITHTGHGWSGRAVNTTFRLAEAEITRKRLALARECPLVAIVSDHWYQAVIREGYGLLNADSYEKVHVTYKEFDETAWISLPDNSAPRHHDPAAPPGSSSGGIVFHGPVTHHGDNVAGSKIVYGRDTP